MLLVAAAILGWGLSMLLLSYVIRSAIDSSGTSQKLDELIVEVQQLKRTIHESKHTIDRRF